VTARPLGFLAGTRAAAHFDYLTRYIDTALVLYRGLVFRNS